MSDENETEPPTKKLKTEEAATEFKETATEFKEATTESKYENTIENIEQNMDFSQDVDVTESNKDFTMNDKYTDYVTAEEIDRLKEFKVLDETKSNDEDSNDDDSDSSEGVPDDEIEKMLDENLPEELKVAPKPKERPYVTRQKIVLEEKGVNQIEVLPLDWMMARHYSGLPVYIHRTTRVCTLSKPYFLAKGNVRRHDIPLSAIPCLAYRRALEEEEKQQEIDKQIQEQIKNGTWRQYAELNDNNEPENPLKAKFPFLNGKILSKNTSNFESVKKCPYSNSAASTKESNDKYKNDVSNNSDCNGKDKGTELTNNDESNEIQTNINEKSINDLSDQNNDIKEQSDITDKLEAKVQENNVQCMTDEDNHLNQNTINEINEGDSKNTKESENLENTEHNKSEISTEVSETNSNDTELVNTENYETENIGTKFNGTDDSVAESSIENSQNEGLTNPTDLPPHIKPVVLPGGIVMPPPRVENVSTSWKTQHLTHEQVNEYCRKLFKFKTINIMHFKRWADRRKYTKSRKTLQYPTLPEGTKLITIPVQNNGENGGKPNKRDWVMNMDGRSYLSVFHEYVCRVLQKQPVYEFKQLENASTPYQATVLIGGMSYGVGVGSSKRAAKSAAAQAAIHVLIPELRHEAGGAQDPHCTFFDYVSIEDPRVSEFCAAACEPSPYAVLRTCLLRNTGQGDRHIHTQMKKLEQQEIELTMRVGRHGATVVCKNKKAAKQRASQAILQALHPQVRSWGSLLRLYGSRSLKSCKEKKLEEQQITLLQDSAKHNEPNYAVLDKLRNEMRKLRERDEAVVPIGTLLVTDDLPTHSGSNLNNVDL